MIQLDILVLEDASPAALGVTLDVMDAADRLSGRPVFNWRVVTGAGQAACLRGGVSLPARPLAEAEPRDLVVVLGLGAATPAEVMARMARPDAMAAASWLGDAWRRGATVAASCTGVFLLGCAGLLDHRRCTTTWWLTPQLKAMFPDCRVEADAMLTVEDRIWTAGAAFAHIDLVLALLADRAGPGLAEDVARHVVVERRASQARYVIPAFLAAQDPVARQVESHVRRCLAAPVSLAELARETGTTSRTLSRRLVQATGLSPMKFVQKIRVDAALHLLQTTRLPLDAVAEQVGFEDCSALYRLVRRHTGKAPGAFRGREGG